MTYSRISIWNKLINTTTREDSCFWFQWSTSENALQRNVAQNTINSRECRNSSSDVMSKPKKSKHQHCTGSCVANCADMLTVATVMVMVKELRGAFRGLKGHSYFTLRSHESIDRCSFDLNCAKELPHFTPSNYSRWFFSEVLLKPDSFSALHWTCLRGSVTSSNAQPARNHREVNPSAVAGIMSPNLHLYLQ